MQVEPNKSNRWRVVFENDGMSVEEVIQPVEAVEPPEVKEYLVEAEEVTPPIITKLYNKKGDLYKVEHIKPNINLKA